MAWTKGVRPKGLDQGVWTTGAWTTGTGQRGLDQRAMTKGPRHLDTQKTNKEQRTVNKEQGTMIKEHQETLLFHKTLFPRSCNHEDSTDKN